MPKYDNSVQWYHEVEVDRREAHKTPIVYLWFPMAWSFLLGVASAYFAWRIAVTANNFTVLNFAMALSAFIPLAFLLYYLAWWLRELMKLNRDAKPPEREWNPNPGLRRDWVRTVNSQTSEQHRAVFIHADDSQLQAIAEHVQAGRSFNVTELAPYFGGNRAAVQTFYSDLVSSKPPMAEWRNPEVHEKGIRLLQEGIDHLYSKLGTPPPQDDDPPVYGRKSVYIRDTEEEE